MRSDTFITPCVVPSRDGVLSFNSTCLRSVELHAFVRSRGRVVWRHSCSSRLPALGLTPLSWNEIRTRAAGSARKWQAAGAERALLLRLDFFDILGLRRVRVTLAGWPTKP